MTQAAIDVSPIPWDRSYYQRLPLRSYETVVPSHNSGTGGAGVTAVLNAPIIRLSTGAAGALKSVENTEWDSFAGASPDAYLRVGEAGTRSFWRRSHVLDCFMTVRTATPGDQDQEHGVTIGSYNANVLAGPWPYQQSIQPDGAATVNVIRFYAAFNTLFGPDWVLAFHRGDAVQQAFALAFVGTGIITPPPVPVIGRSYHIRLVYEPVGTTTSRIRLYLDGTLYVDIDDNALGGLANGFMPTPTPISGGAGGGIYVTSGGLATGVSVADFMGLRIYARGSV